MAQPDAWEEVCLIAISKQGGSDVQFAALTTSIDIDQGMKDITQIDLVGGVCAVHHMPESITTITLEAYPVEVSTPSGTAGKGFWDLLHPTNDTTQPISIPANKNKSKIRVAFLWTDEASVTNATEEIAAASTAYRLVYADAFVTAVKPRFTDGILLFVITIKIPANDGGKPTSAISNIDGSATTITVDTSESHGLTAGNWVTIAGTSAYDGVYKVNAITDVNTFTISDTAHDLSAETTGNVLYNSANNKEESHDGTGSTVLGALASYTKDAKW